MDGAVGTVKDTISLGAGDDTLTYQAAGDLDRTDVLTGGDGTDTLSALVADLNTTNFATASTTITGFETINVSNTMAGTVTLANIQATGLDKVVLAAGGTGTLNVGAGASTVDLKDVLTGALTVDAAGTATDDALTVNNKDAAANAFAGQAVTTTDFETVNISTTGSGVATIQTFGNVSMTASTGGTTTLNVTGTNEADMNGTITAAVVDASGMTGVGHLDLAGATMSGLTTLTGSAQSDVLLGDTSSTIDGGAGNDTITGGSGNDTLTGGEGNDTITTDAGTDTVTGGAGDDIVVLTDGDASSADSVDGGEGTDTLAMSEAVTADEMVGYTGFEKLRYDEAAAQNLALIPGTNVITHIIHADAAGNITLTNASSSVTTLQLLDDNSAGTVSFDRLVDGSSDSLTIAASTTQDSTDYATVTVNDEETLTISSGDATSETLTIDTLNATDLTSLTLTGTGAITITNAIGNQTKLATVDASSMAAAVDVDATSSAVVVTMTGGSAADVLEGGIRADIINGNDGGDTLIGNQGADTINGGAGADEISGGVGADILTGGAGADDFNFSDGDNSTITVAGADTITDFTTGSDEFDIDGYAVASVATDLSINDGTSVADLTALIALADAFFATAGAGAVVADGVYVSYNALGTGDAYVFADTDNSAAFDAGDVFLILSGIDKAAEIVTGDFI